MGNFLFDICKKLTILKKNNVNQNYSHLKSVSSSPVNYLVSTLFFTVVIPRHSLRCQNLRHFYKTAEMNTLAPCYREFLLYDGTITDTRTAVTDIL